MSVLRYTSHDVILKELRSVILEITNLPGDRVVNGFSVRGADLAKILDDVRQTTPDLSNCFIVFQFTMDDDTEARYFVSYHHEGASEVVMPYAMDLKIYGEFAPMLASHLVANLKSPHYAQKLLDKGIRVYNVTKPTSVNEFINNTVWPRCDLTIRMVTHTLEHVVAEGFVEEIGDPKIITDK